MARSTYIIPENFLSSNLKTVEDWKISMTVHAAPKGGNWYQTNQLELGREVDMPADRLIARPIQVTNMEMGTTKSGKEFEHGKNDVPLFCAVKWADKNGGRSIKKVETVSAMVFDFDGLTDEDKEATLNAFSGVCHIAYSSYSNKAEYKQGLNAFRVIVALDRAVLPSEYADQYRRGFWYAMESVFPHLDEATKDPCRFWFMPSFRIDRQDLSWTKKEDGLVLCVDNIVEAGMDLQPPPPVSSTPATSTAQASEDTDSEEEASEDEAATPRRYITRVVRDDHFVVCHDGVSRPFSWVIENWDNLRKQSNGNYNCCRPNSTTVGSAFVQRQVHPMHRVARYRLTSTPNRTHHDCDTTDNGIALAFSNRGFRPKVTVPNVVKMLDAMDIDLWEDARTGYQYLEGERFEDYHYTVVQDMFSDHYRVDAPRASLMTAIDSFCQSNKIDTLKTYLEDLEWDGTERLEELFIKYLKAADTGMNRTYARKWGISCVARALDWGCKMDTMVILKGSQGLRKSTFFEVMAGTCPLTGNSFFSDEPIEVTGVDGLTKLRLAWIHEWAELSGMSRKESGDVKQFITKRTDRYRKKYGRKETIADRHCVIVGTVNDDEIFKDDTGSRRFWAVECHGEEHKQAFDTAELSAARDQLWAEAVHYYKQGEQWWLTEEEQKQSARTNSKFDSVDVHQILVEEWLANNSGRIFCLSDMIEDIYMETYEVDGEERKRAKAVKPKSYMNWYSQCLKGLGCGMLNDGKKCRHNKKLSRWYVAPDVDEEDEFVATTDISNGKTMEVKMDTNPQSERYGMVKCVRKFGEDWTMYEDMSPLVQADWDQRYPKKSRLKVEPTQSSIDELDDILDQQVFGRRRFRL